MKLHRRLPRVDLPNATYFASVSTAERIAWFADPTRAEALCWLICRERGRSVLLHAFVVMPHHYHLLVTLLGDHRVPGVVQRVKSICARQVNAALGRRGRLWAHRFYDHVVRNAEDFAECMKYIHDNPRASGLAASPTAYPFSSASYWETGQSRWGEFDPP